MHLTKRFILALAAKTATAMVVGPPKPGAGLPNNAYPQPTVMPTKEALTGLKKDVKKSQNHGPAQIVLVGCPEMFDDDPMACGLCGNEDPEQKGYCKDRNASDWKCRCLPINKAGATTSVITTTVGSDTATGTFELDTMTDYAGLRQSITITTTVTPTSSGDAGIKTVAAVVLAGGVAWFLAESSGGAAAIAALKPPTEAKDHKDDQKCPKPEHQCKDCGGEKGICKKGDAAGCACEEQSCPTDGADDQPVCTDDEACDANDEGVCTVGEHKDCKCKKPNCPAIDRNDFWCAADCGGKGADGKCKGWSDENGNFQGCECRDDPNFSTAPPALHRQDTAAHRHSLAHFPDIEYGNSPADLPSPKCDMNKASRVPWNVFSPGVYQSFCNSITDKTKKNKKDARVNSKGEEQTPKRAVSRSSRRTPPPNPDTYSKYTFDLHWTGGDNSCFSDCAASFAAIAASPCGHTAGEQNIMATATSLDTGCGTYSYEITGPPPPPPPPSKPDEWLPTCVDKTVQTPFRRTQAVDAIRDFCSHDITLPDAAQLLWKVFHLKDVTLQLSTQWTLSGRSGCAAYRPENKHLTNAECTAGFLAAVDSCDTDTVSKKFGARPIVWDGPKGCIDFTLYGDGKDWTCPKLGFIPDQCTDPPKGVQIP